MVIPFLAKVRILSPSLHHWCCSFLPQHRLGLDYHGSVMLLAIKTEWCCKSFPCVLCGYIGDMIVWQSDVNLWKFSMNVWSKCGCSHGVCWLWLALPGQMGWKGEGWLVLWSMYWGAPDYKSYLWLLETSYFSLQVVSNCFIKSIIMNTKVPHISLVPSCIVWSCPPSMMLLPGWCVCLILASWYFVPIKVFLSAWFNRWVSCIPGNVSCTKVG